ncbi:MAG: hypothetical protein PHN75_08640, partial [Syntrophales bacterium]|nr:hypothetical protein [Syntrophales bacterium]
MPKVTMTLTFFDGRPYSVLHGLASRTNPSFGPHPVNLYRFVAKAALIYFILLISLCACGEKEKQSPAATPPPVDQKA